MLNSFIKILGFGGLFLSLLISCKKDDTPIETPQVSQPGYNFKEQNLQGMIEGQPWEFISGRANRTTFNDQEEYAIALYSESAENSCMFLPKEDRVIFSIPSTGISGVQQLKLDFSGNSDSRTITLYDVQQSNNVIASEGAVEVVSIDTTNQVIELKIDARYDDQNFINGKCKIQICM